MADAAGQPPVSRQPLDRRSYKDLAADRLRQRIFAGEIRPHERVDQEQLATELGISKLPIREALIALETEGLVVNQPHRGSFVAPLSREDVRDHYRIIGYLAGLAARRATQEMSDEQLERLEACLLELEQERDPDGQGRLNLEFHRTINRVGASRRVRSVLRLLTNTNPNRFYEFADGWAEVAKHEHRSIMTALRDRDGDTAERAMVEHIVSGGEFGIRTMEASGFWDHETMADR